MPSQGSHQATSLFIVYHRTAGTADLYHRSISPEITALPSSLKVKNDSSLLRVHPFIDTEDLLSWWENRQSAYALGFVAE